MFNEEVIYYMVELVSIVDNISYPIFIDGKDLPALISNYDKDNYKLVNVTGLGYINTDYKDFLKKEPNLETGENSNVS